MTTKTYAAGARLIALAGPLLVIAGCQGHLPDVQHSLLAGPNVGDVINHIQCELATIVNNGPDGNTLNKQLGKRIADDGKLKNLIPYLVSDHFVATAQLTLEVTDVEGLSPSLSFINGPTTLTIGVGGQLSGTQDRSLTINYSVDLARLQSPDYVNAFCGGSVESASKGEGIGGDLGMADIVADGLSALNESSTANVYSSAGPSPAVTARAIDLNGQLLPSPPTPPYRIEQLAGAIVFQPQAIGVLTQGSVTLTGVADVAQAGRSSQYVVNWTGSLVPQPDAAKLQYFTMTGSFLPAPENSSTPVWGFNPTVSVTGEINQFFDLNSLKIDGVLTPQTGAAISKPVAISLSQPTRHGAVAGTTPGAKGSSVSAGAAGGTSFGSLVDFVLVAGVNGGPNWSFKHFKGPANGSSALLSATHTNTDSLSITFVPSCQSYDQVKPQIQQKAFWDTIGACDEAGTAQLLSSSIGYENNSLMILKQLVVRP